LDFITNNLSVSEETEWENVLSKLLHCCDDKHKFLMSLGFGWEAVKILKLNGSPADNAREVIMVLIDKLPKSSRELLFTRVEASSIPNWITGVTTWN